MNAVDSGGRPWVGALVVVGPDLKIWTFSSNPAIHDQDASVACVAGIYRAGVANAVDPDLLAERLAALTVDARRQEAAILADAAAGSLRRRQDRQLP